MPVCVFPPSVYTLSGNHSAVQRGQLPGHKRDARRSWQASPRAAGALNHLGVLNGAVFEPTSNGEGAREGGGASAVSQLVLPSSSCA